jgi:hypothetical protein
MALAAIVLLAACGDRTVTASTTERSLRAQRSAAFDVALGPEVERDLATLRRVTAPFHDFAVARRAGWSTQITPCMTDPAGAGGMGFHYGNTTLIDGTARVDAPQLLLYEPEQNGKLRLVAVEYIIPYTFHSRDAEPPVLFGQKFQQNDVFQLWGLHAWVWENNPNGIFANWNPRVDCANATDVMRMAH